MTWRIHPGDTRASLAAMPERSARCCVTSPPYWGLRDYGHDGQIGLEPTPAAYVAAMVKVFAAVRRVLTDDGTLWLNLGDSYAATSRGGDSSTYKTTDDKRAEKSAEIFGAERRRVALPDGLKPKDLVGIPWRVAFALQQPHYNGAIKNVEDRIWLAAMLDAEGCLFIHKRKVGQSNGQGYERQSDSYAPGVEICNTHPAIIDRIMAIVGNGSVCTSEKGKHGRKQTLYRWNLRTTESRAFVTELYPYLIAKQQQARVLCGCPSSGERAEAAHAALIALHAGIPTDVDFPAPASLHEKGWYLRSDIIWAKNNPMPESVTDRPTKSHEYLFLLAKSERYYFDAKAIAEDCVRGDAGSSFTSEYDLVTKPGLGTEPRKRTMPPIGGVKKAGGDNATYSGNTPEFGTTRNKRDVWTIATQPYSGAHFATYPEALVEPCILAGSAVGDTVLDPFSGSGTTGAVAVRHGRNYAGCELNPAYIKLSEARIGKEAPLFVSGGAS